MSSAREAPAGTATASATLAGASVTVWATNLRLAPFELHATTIARGVDLAVLRAYLPPALPAMPERGVVNATVTVDHGARGTRLAVDAGVSGLEVVRPGHAVTAPALRVLADEVLLDGSGVTVKQASVTGARLTLEERSATPVRTWVVQDLAVEARDLSNRRDAAEGVATVQAAVAGATVSAWMTPRAPRSRRVPHDDEPPQRRPRAAPPLSPDRGAGRSSPAVRSTPRSTSTTR